MCLNHHPQNTQDKKTNKKKGFEFCKIIHSNIIQDQCLILPLKFVQNYGNDVSNAAVLKVPDGKRWHVELRKTDGQITFHNGWQELVEYYSISTGHFLVFRYNGNSTFRVIVFDATCSEIDYPNNVDNLQEQNCDEERLNSDCDANGNNSSKKREEFAIMPSVKRHSSPKTPVTKSSAVLGKEKDGAPSFTVVLTASYLHYLLIPASFSNRHHLQGSLKDLTLEVSEGHRWLIRCILYKTNIHLSRGWQKFAKENNLKAGDVCVFEMIEHALWKVHISQKWTSSPTLLKEEDGRHSTAKKGKGVVVPILERHLCAKASVTSKQKTGTTEASRVLKLKHPSFTTVITSSYLRYMLIPASFSIRHHLKGSLKNLTLEVSEGHRWLIGCILYRGANLHLSKGWKKFVKQNNLKAGDVCVFEMIEHALWKVHISRKWTSSRTSLEEEEDAHLSTAKQGKGAVVPILERHLCAKASVTSKEKTGTTETSRVLKLKLPSFTRVITSSYLHYLRIPTSFFVRYLKDDNLRSVTLEVSGGRRWPIGASLYNSSNVHVTKGWQKFVRENDLKEGDVCVFEMIKVALWKVHISRNSKHVLPTFKKRKRMDIIHQQNKKRVILCRSLTGKTRAVEASL
ncbi:B3 domain-containing transcription factor vrn1 [Thalictrum thalictroides]|uniref:B3 domain-containing transcription factor vrn1 n=1 Tax=Thalictrum thalictroides TaxID=46969 RepID=A0A7J6VUB1_THATH|nr:B3 domain-containing transcription factor vrn1 [Thalictrum thalictroides]